MRLQLRKNAGFTLIELILVIVIMGVLSTIAMKALSSSVEQRRFESTVGEMEDIARAIAGDDRLVSSGFRKNFGYMGDVGSLPASLDALVSNSGGYSTWNGPYIRNDFSQDTEDYKRDAWNELYTYTGGITLASNGGGSTISKQFANTIADLTSNSVQGVIRDSRLIPPGDSASTVSITLQFPDGSGSMTSSTISPSGSGEFTFSSSIPIGIHSIRAIVNSDTVSKNIAVYPGQITSTELRFAVSIW